MVHRSIFTRLTLFFAFIVAAIMVGFYFLSFEIDQQHRNILEKESDRMLALVRQTILQSDTARKAFFEERGYSYEAITPEAKAGLTPAFKSVPERFNAQIQSSLKEGRIQIMVSPTTLYVLINRSEPPFMIGVPHSNPYLMWLRGSLFVLLLLIVALYLSIIHSLLPLKQLAQAIRKYGDNGTYVPTKSSGKDEIAYVANAFDEAVRKNRALTEARRLFMRNVTHELKTPITVGKLSLPFLEKGAETQILERAFMRMELLLDDMAHIEQVTSQSGKRNNERCRLARLTDEAVELMISSDGTIVHEFDADDTILADCRMMTTVFKNFIDNAFKYSDDKRVLIRREGDTLLFINRGKEWPEEQQFEAMLEPFMYNNPDELSKSFGLGLYIVKSILETHKMGLSHYYRDGMQHFVIENIPRVDKA